MMKALGLFAALAVSVVGVWMFSFPTARIRYRLTVEVSTPEGLKSGSAVNQVGYSIEPRIGNAGFSMGVRFGEAVAVDLGSRGTLYALLVGRNSKTDGPDQGKDPADMYLRTLAPELVKGPNNAEFIRALRSVNKTADVPSHLIPMLVRFRDEKDPKTVEAVDPANLAAGFGDGVNLKRVWIETVSGGVFPFNMFGMTGEPLTSGIEKRLVWLENKKGALIYTGQYDRTRPANNLTARDFKRGVKAR